MRRLGIVAVGLALVAAAAVVALLGGPHLRGSGTEPAMANPGLTMGVDAGQDGTSGGGRTMALESKGSVDIRVDQLDSLTYTLYEVRVRYDDAKLDLTLPHDEWAGNKWPGVDEDTGICVDIDPTEDDTGTKDWMGGCLQLPTHFSPSSYTGVLHTLEFRCEAAGDAGIQLIVGTDDDTYLANEYIGELYYPVTTVQDTITCTAAVGGVAELPDVAGPTGTSGMGGATYAVLAGVAAGVLAFAVLATLSVKRRGVR